MTMKLAGLLLITLTIPAVAQAPANYPAPVEADYVIRNFVFSTGDTMPELRIHYTTIGKPAPRAASRAEPTTTSCRRLRREWWQEHGALVLFDR